MCHCRVGKKQLNTAELKFQRMIIEQAPKKLPVFATVEAFPICKQRTIRIIAIIITLCNPKQILEG